MAKHNRNYKPEDILFSDQVITESNLVDEMEKSYIEYAMSVIVGRALPDVRDGLKPVHRRILYTMHEDGFTPDKAHLIVNGVAMSARGLTNIPAGIEVMPTAPVSNAAPVLPVDNNNPQNQTRSEEEMPITNVDELRAAPPELVAQVENAARAEGRTEGANQERTRIQGIEAIQNAIADNALINDAKFGANPLTAEQLAFKAMQAQAAIGNTMLNNMTADNKASGVANVATAPNAGPEVKDGNPTDAKAAADEAVQLFNMMNGGNK